MFRTVYEGSRFSLFSDEYEKFFLQIGQDFAPIFCSLVYMLVVDAHHALCHISSQTFLTQYFAYFEGGRDASSIRYTSSSRLTAASEAKCRSNAGNVFFRNTISY